MKLTPANRQIDGIEIKVFDPDTGRALARDAVIDLDTLPTTKQQHYLRILADGDLVEVIADPEAKPAKPPKEQ